MAPAHPTNPDNPVTLHGGMLAAMRVAWVVLVLGAIGPTLFSIPAYFGQVLDYSAAGAEGAFQNWTAEALRAAVGALGISSTGLAVFVVFTTLLSFVIFSAVGLVIFIRRSDQLVGLLTSFLLFTVGLSFGSGIGSNLARFSPALAAIHNQIFAWIWALFFIFFTLFPDGRFVPRWTRWLPLVWIVLVLAVMVESLKPLTNLPMAVLFIVSLGSQLYRYRWSAGALERQQIRWFAAAAVAFGLYWIPQFPFINLPGMLFPALNQLGPARLLFDLISQVIGVLVSALLPVSIGIALLRYHLWDLDFIIRRTLLYGLLSGLLGLVYFGSVLLLRQLLGGLAGESSPALVLSTLLIAALFTPLRRRLQAAIDRRFYRQKYDTARALESYSSAVRSQVDLADLTGQLVGVVQETVQPESVTLWLREDRR